ncbi:hypothetical protein [Lacrimispora sp.]|uniref:hypothetical protein n=1 Tax=Lacrimispora sp. TaxID=2719234 RepID=UPI0028A66DEB|nr:hypothetical protein [Lacrimispora sp.]
MTEYMNEPINYEFTEQDIIDEYIKCGDIRKVAGIYCLEKKSVKTILKNEGVL